MIKYKKMSLFDAPEGSTLVHACNAQGVWGSGIAKEFKDRYPRSYAEYLKFCENHFTQAGDTLIHNQENKRHVVSMITSWDYGKNRSYPAVILVNTVLALEDFVNCLSFDVKQPIYSNKFNSGAFKVPWTDTETILQVFVERYRLDWTVCEYE